MLHWRAVPTRKTFKSPCIIVLLFFPTEKRVQIMFSLSPPPQYSHTKLPFPRGRNVQRKWKIKLSFTFPKAFSVSCPLFPNVTNKTKTDWQPTRPAFVQCSEPSKPLVLLSWNWTNYMSQQIVHHMVNVYDIRLSRTLEWASLVSWSRTDKLLFFVYIHVWV